MNLVTSLIALATAINGLLSGLNIDTALLSILHTFATTRAASVMLSIKDIPDYEALLTAKFDRFARWHTVRATFQVVAFFVLVWALAIV
jgi:hypothetical protein